MAFKMKDTGLYKRTASKNGSTFMHTAKFGANTSVGEMEAVKKHNKRHQAGETHAPGKYPTGKYKDSVINKGEWSAKKEGGEGGPKKYKKAKPVAKKYKKAEPAAKKHHAMKKHEPAHKKHHAMKKHEPGHGGNSTVAQLEKELKKAMAEGNDRKVNEIRKKLMAMYKAQKGGPKKYKK